MPLFKKYKEQASFLSKVKRSSSTKDTTIPNMLGYGSNSSNKDYGKIKSKGGVSKVKTVKNKYKVKPKKK